MLRNCDSEERCPIWLLFCHAGTLQVGGCCFNPAVVSLSAHRWLVYDDKGHFQCTDESTAEDYDLYDYGEDESPPPGCTFGSRPSFLLNNVPASATWSDVAVNKAAFGISEQALPLCNTASAGGSCQALAVLPYVCTAVLARVATSSGSFSAVIPVPAVAVGLLFVALALASLVLLAGSVLRRQILQK